MGFEAKVLADSVSPAGQRLTTLEATFPRFILAEFNTHRVFSRNSASSRAIPVAKQLRRLLDDPYVPIEFGSNKPGMQAGPSLTGAARDAAEAEWLRARDDAVRHVLGLITSPENVAGFENLHECLESAQGSLKEPPAEWLNVHKQVANRLLEPFMWHTVIVSSTTWENFFNLRCHPDAQPEIRLIATKMRDAVERSVPTRLEPDEWHLPLIGEAEREEASSPEELAKISIGRCARVSYLTHAGTRDLSADVALYDRLLESGHMSPMEHVARPMTPTELDRSEWSGNFQGWIAHRKSIPGESNPLAGTQIEEIEISPDETVAA
jgi:thymidylate synthase ThyX